MGISDLLRSTEHFGSHANATFEGWYSKFRLPSGGSIALIISSVPGIAKQCDDERSRSASNPGVPTDQTFSAQNGSPQSRLDPPYMISFTYVNADSTRWFQRELHPELNTQPYRADLAEGICASLKTEFDPEGGSKPPTPSSSASSASADLPSAASPNTTIADPSGFTIYYPSGSFSWSGPASDLITWSIRSPDFTFIARTTSARTPWIARDEASTPAGALADLPLPVQWHVHSLDSACDFVLDIHPNGADSAQIDGQGEAAEKGDGGELITVHKLDRSGQGRVHCEKNWAYSFPASYIWLQARTHPDTDAAEDGESRASAHSGSGICIAGGSLFRGVQAYLIGYHPSSPQSSSSSPPQSISFAPPTSTSLFGLSLGTTTSIAYSASSPSTLEIRVNGWFTRLLVEATAEAGTFFPLSAPLKTGHRPGYTVQSFAARIKVRRWVRQRLWGKWEEVRGDEWDQGSLEFGGDLYKAHAE